MSDPAKLFGALLENSDSKETDRSEQNDEGEVEDGDIASQIDRVSHKLILYRKRFSV